MTGTNPPGIGVFDSRTRGDSRGQAFGRHSAIVRLNWRTCKSGFIAPGALMDAVLLAWAWVQRQGGLIGASLFDLSSSQNANERPGKDG
jgi:hypothetical protein